MSQSKMMQRRNRVLDEVIEHLADPQKRDEVLQTALGNVDRWKKYSKQQTSAPCVIRVLKDDWGAAAAAVTAEFGQVFAVLNMANATVAGGGYLDGMPAQEENMFRRTDCHFQVTGGSTEKTMIFYPPHKTALLNAENGKVFLDVERPRVCVRGPEAEDYRWLDKTEVFPFYELRAAAQDCRRMKFSAENARERIKAQFATLKEKKVKHVVLSAFGCGKRLWVVCSMYMFVLKIYVGFCGGFGWMV